VKYLSFGLIPFYLFRDLLVLERKKLFLSLLRFSTWGPEHETNKCQSNNRKGVQLLLIVMYAGVHRKEAELKAILKLGGLYKDFNKG
jgi:hypothetical protein